MSKWFVKFGPEAEDDLDKLDGVVRKRVLEKLEWLQNNFDNLTPATLGYNWHGFFKIRIGDWRAVYKIKQTENKIIIIAIGHRNKIYKRKLK